MLEKAPPAPLSLHDHERLPAEWRVSTAVAVNVVIPPDGTVVGEVEAVTVTVCPLAAGCTVSAVAADPEADGEPLHVARTVSMIVTLAPPVLAGAL